MSDARRDSFDAYASGQGATAIPSPPGMGASPARHSASPDGGPMGVGQPAAAGPAAGYYTCFIGGCGHVWPRAEGASAASAACPRCKPRPRYLAALPEGDSQAAHDFAAALAQLLPLARAVGWRLTLEPLPEGGAS